MAASEAATTERRSDRVLKRHDISASSFDKLKMSQLNLMVSLSNQVLLSGFLEALDHLMGRLVERSPAFLERGLQSIPRFHPGLLLCLKLGFRRIRRRLQLIESLLCVFLVGRSEGVGFSPQIFYRFLPGFSLSLSARRERLL